MVPPRPALVTREDVRSPPYSIPCFPLTAVGAWASRRNCSPARPGSHQKQKVPNGRTRTAPSRLGSPREGYQAAPEYPRASRPLPAALPHCRAFLGRSSRKSGIIGHLARLPSPLAARAIGAELFGGSPLAAASPPDSGRGIYGIGHYARGRRRRPRVSGSVPSDRSWAARFGVRWDRPYGGDRNSNSVTGRRNAAPGCRTRAFRTDSTSRSIGSAACSAKRRPTPAVERSSPVLSPVTSASIR